MSMTIRNLRYFSAVAEARSVVGATLLLNISQSAIAEAIKVLETDLGIALFERHPRGMLLTHAGQQFLRHAQQILQSVSDAKQAMMVRPDALSGRLNIGVTPLVTGYILPHLLDRYRRVFPAVKVGVVEDQRSYVEHLLVGGELELGMLMVSQLKNRDALVSSTIAQSAWRLWVSPSHPLHGRTMVSLAELAEEPFIATMLDELEDATLPFWRKAGLSPKVAVRTSSIEAVRCLVARGVGITILPDVFYRPWSLDGERIEWIPIKESIPPLEIGLAWRGGLAQNAATQNFLSLALEYGQ